jgi:hypothetical protein
MNSQPWCQVEELLVVEEMARERMTWTKVAVTSMAHEKISIGRSINR